MLFRSGLTGEEKTALLSGGEARRAGLAHVLVANPDILLLDEPTNHLDLPTIEKIENHLGRPTALVWAGIWEGLKSSAIVSGTLQELRPGTCRFGCCLELHAPGTHRRPIWTDLEPFRGP